MGVADDKDYERFLQWAADWAREAPRQARTIQDAMDNVEITNQDRVSALVERAAGEGFVTVVGRPADPAARAQTILAIKTKVIGAVRALDAQQRDRAACASGWLRRLPGVGHVIGASESLSPIVGFIGGILGIISIVVSVIALWVAKAR
jgi:hypothetical protein